MDKVIPVSIALLEIFRDRGNRDSRKRARLKFLIDDMGADTFREALVKHLGYDLDPAADAEINPHAFRDHLGLQEQMEPGLYTLGFTTTSGRITPEDLFVAADIADQFGSGQLSNSCMQNILVHDIPENQLDDAQDMALNAPTLSLSTDPIRAGMIVCTGTEFCTLALAETKVRSFEILDYLEKTVQLDTPIKIGISGCPNSCSQYLIADIGLRGGKTRVNDEQVDAYDIYAGCELGKNQEFGHSIKKAVPAEDVAIELAELLRTYMNDRQDGETIKQYYNRMETMSYSI